MFTVKDKDIDFAFDSSELGSCLHNQSRVRELHQDSQHAITCRITRSDVVWLGRR
jgi:hypothetical protein